MNEKALNGASPVKHLLDALSTDLPAWLAARGERSFRLNQLRRWLFRSRVERFEQMTDIPQSLREALAQDFTWWTSEVVAHKQAADGTEKLLLQVAGGGRIECVLLRDGDRRTICISSQVGCAMGCVFCASGLDGVERNLTTGEILEQMLRLQRLLPADERLSHIVVMGMGEPLANLDRLLAALGEAVNPQGLGISPRRITISTVGLPPAIRRLAAEDARFNLAVSLHAPDDELRNRLVPVNKNIGIKSILEAADEYFERSGRKLTFEYVLLGELNDRPEHAKRLAQLLRGRTAMLNVIPYNRVSGLPYHAPSSEAAERFRRILEQSGINVQFRQQKGDQIAAACGQLRRSSTSAASTTVMPSAASSLDVSSMRNG